MTNTMGSIWAKIIMKLFGEEKDGGFVAAQECSTNNSFLPEELIDMILSRLPVKSLLRFKCVCKYWNSTILDPRFISLHHKLSQPRFIFNNPEGGRHPEFFVMTSAAGLLLEQTDDRRIRIRNPEMRKILHLPNPRRKHRCLYIDFTVLFSSDDCDNPVFKLVSVHKTGHDDQAMIGYEILDLGNYDEPRYSYCWRTLKVPKMSSNDQIRNIQFLIISGIGYCIWETGAPEDADIKIDILDIKNERYIGRTTCPHRGFFSTLSSNDYLFWSDQQQLAFARIVKDDHELHILVLDDYKKQRWADRVSVIKLSPDLLKITTDLLLRTEHIDLLWACQFELVFHWRRGDLLCTYDVNTGEVTTELYCPIPLTTNIKPSLYTFKGMSPQS